MLIFASTKIANFVLGMGKRVIVYSCLREASEGLGLTESAVSKRLKDGRGLEWLERVYAIKTKDGVWKVGSESRDNKAYLLLDDMGGRVRKRDVERAVDITESWYVSR